MSTINVKDASGATVSVNVPNDDGRAAASSSRSVCLATEDQATLAGIATQATLSALNTKVPAQGQAAMAASIPVVIANNQSAVPISASSLPLPTGAATAANQTTTNTSLASIDGKMPTLTSGRQPVASSFPVSASASILSATTNATGSNWTAFVSSACSALDLANNTGVTIEYRRGAAGTAFPIPSGSARLIIGITNANQIDVRRVDQSNTQVTVQAEAYVL